MLLYILTPISSPLMISLLILYFLLACITTYDIRITQGKKAGILPADYPSFGMSMNIILWIEWAVWIAIMILNWKMDLIAWGAKFILKVLPVLEKIRALMVSPF
jgi:hypothetical protein